MKMWCQEKGQLDKNESMGRQHGDGGVDALGEHGKVVADEDDALLAHQRAKDVDDALHVEARHQRRQLHVDQRSVHVAWTDELVLVHVELASRLGKSRLAAGTHEVQHLLGLQTGHRLRDLHDMGEDCEVGSVVKTVKSIYLFVT